MRKSAAQKSRELERDLAKYVETKPLKHNKVSQISMSADRAMTVQLKSGVEFTLSNEDKDIQALVVFMMLQ